MRLLGWKTDYSTLLSAEISPRQIAVRNHNAVESGRTRREKSASLFCLFKSHRLRDHGECAWKQEIICLAKSTPYSLPRSLYISAMWPVERFSVIALHVCWISDEIAPFPALLFMNFRMQRVVSAPSNLSQLQQNPFQCSFISAWHVKETEHCVF